MSIIDSDISGMVRKRELGHTFTARGSGCDAGRNISSLFIVVTHAMMSQHQFYHEASKAMEILFMVSALAPLQGLTGA